MQQLKAPDKPVLVESVLGVSQGDLRAKSKADDYAQNNSKFSLFSPHLVYLLVVTPQLKDDGGVISGRILKKQRFRTVF